MNEIDREARNHCDHDWACHKCNATLQYQSVEPDAQLAALRDERDRARRTLKTVMFRAIVDLDNPRCLKVLREDFAPGDFDYLRQLIESEEGQ